MEVPYRVPQVLREIQTRVAERDLGHPERARRQKPMSAHLEVEQRELEIEVAHRQAPFAPQ